MPLKFKNNGATKEKSKTPVGCGRLFEFEWKGEGVGVKFFCL